MLKELSELIQHLQRKCDNTLRSGLIPPTILFNKEEE